MVTHDEESRAAWHENGNTLAQCIPSDSTTITSSPPNINQNESDHYSEDTHITTAPHTLSTHDIPRFHIANLTQHNIGQIKLLNMTTLRVSYPSAFYDELYKHHLYSRLAYAGDILIGAICCRLESYPDETDVYILTLSVLEPYRNRGIASCLLQSVLTEASNQKEISKVYLHVWVESNAAMRFYKKHNFIFGEKIEDYYNNLEPTAGYYVYCPLPWKATKNDEDEKNNALAVSNSSSTAAVVAPPNHDTSEREKREDQSFHTNSIS